MIKRQLSEFLSEKINSGKILLVIGPRQVGKTTLIRSFLEGKDYLFLDGDNPAVQTLLDEPSTEQIRAILGLYNLIFIDEAQRLNGIGITLKIIADQFKDVKVLVSGSSAFELNSLLSEPLTGRKWTYHLFPISWQEYEQYVGFLKAEQTLEERMVYGMYPEIIMYSEYQLEALKELVSSYLFKDVLAFAGIRKPDMLENLLKSLAWQIGQEVSYSELSSHLRIDVKTISYYIDILEKSYVIFRLPAFSKNVRNEIKTNKKIYFYDNGVRNALIGNYDPISLRNDRGALWENFLISERKKQLVYQKSQVQSYFWRTKQQQEIDYVETDYQSIKAFEIKWNAAKKIRFPKTFSQAYDAQETGIHRENFRDFLQIN